MAENCAQDAFPSSKTIGPISPLTVVKDDNSMFCMLCDKATFPASESGLQNPLLAHLMLEHKLVIAEVQKIANFPKYVGYWRERFRSVQDLTEICVLINTNTGAEDKAPQEKFYMLTDFLPEDHDLRDKLKTEKLASMLDEQQRERMDKSFNRRCLFCKQMFKGNRAALFRHMAGEHTFNLGNADNIVHANEYLDILQKLLDNFQCLFCEKQFKDWSMLKDHMRKKGHKRIDPANKSYDKFYLINYIAPGEDWKELQLDPEYEKELEEEEEKADPRREKEWEDWTEMSPKTSCLFCAHSHEDLNSVLKHMKDIHTFDLQSLKETLGLGFYHQVKIVNFIRKQVCENKCPSCLEALQTKGDLQSHLSIHGHAALPSDQGVWDRPEYFFPTFEDDTLLCFLEDDPEEDENGNLPS